MADIYTIDATGGKFTQKRFNEFCSYIKTENELVHIVVDDIDECVPYNQLRALLETKELAEIFESKPNDICSFACEDAALIVDTNDVTWWQKQKDGKFVKMDGKWNARYFILYYSASWCGPCRASLPRNLEVYRDKIAPRKDLEVVLCSMDHALEGAQKWAVSNKMPWPVFLFGYLDNLSKESPLIRKNYPGPIPSLVLVDANGNKIASGSMDGLVRKVEELASAEKEKEATAESE